LTSTLQQQQQLQGSSRQATHSLQQQLALHQPHQQQQLLVLPLLVLLHKLHN
jgi:hypothetical protein